VAHSSSPPAENTVPRAVWQVSGTTEHLGGISATRRLIEHCPIRPRQLLLDLGCGTGYTACYLADQHQASVVALDVGEVSVHKTRRRVATGGLGESVSVVRADAHRLPFRDSAFDALLAESLLVFCQADLVAAQIDRALKPGGAFGLNELTFLKPPPGELSVLLLDTLGIRARQQAEWQLLLDGAGLITTWSSLHRFSLREQLRSHIAVDGVRGYLSALRRGLSDARLSSTFINRGMLRAARQFLPYVGYGLYAGTKASRRGQQTAAFLPAQQRSAASSAAGEASQAQSSPLRRSGQA
jgi:SAM-dependent methyltransferase